MRKKGYKNAQIRFIRAQFFVQPLRTVLISIKKVENIGGKSIDLIW
jgi:hypothetical protein